MTRDDIERNTISFLRTAGGTRPDLRLAEIDGRRIVVKDFRGCDPLFRALIGPIMVRREKAALTKLQGLNGVPRLVGQVDRYAMAVEHVDGTSLADLQGPPPEAFFDELAEVMRAIHERGVTHCDLRSSGNVVVTRDGRPHAVDFAACVIKGRGWNPLVNFLFRRFVEGDLYAVLVLKRKHAPESLRPEEVDRLATPLPYERAAIRIGVAVRNLARRLLTREPTAPK